MDLFVNMMYRDPNMTVGNGSDDDDDPSLVPLYDIADANADAPANHVPVSLPHPSSVPEPPTFEPPATKEAPPQHITCWPGQDVSPQSF
ncbi:hypothetical protein PILCRDRAFT_12617 [Piloderma croceum F 1598]|uniref:Uncharacterized protein n=1 Tax=Piloderma croceum (strain F 1598) TaxID=765440 RepID=A0A0C3ARJ5_PILCF|nr:hypothetical protein PILCRDRAFT_12617 [Piloderma croceum F 1598]